MTLTSTPPTYSSVNDDLVYVAYDANSIDPTKLNYKYVAEVWIGGVNIFTARQFPSPAGSFGIFNISSIVREYITPILKPELKEGEFSIDVVLKLREEYNGTVGAVVLTDSARTFYNHYNGRINGFTILGNYANKPATDRDRNIDLFSNTANYYIPYFSLSSSPFNVIINGVTTTLTPTAAKSMQNINIAVGATSSYSVVFPTKTYNVNVICEPLTRHYIIHFLNKYGGFDSISFSKLSKSSFEIERKTFQQPAFRVNGSGVVNVKSGNIMNEQRTNFGVSYDEKLKLNTDMLTDQDFVWLEQLLFSPMVYLQDGTDIYPITIEGTSYEDKQYISDGLQNLSIDIKFGRKYLTQFR